MITYLFDINSHNIYDLNINSTVGILKNNKVTSIKIMFVAIVLFIILGIISASPVLAASTAIKISPLILKYSLRKGQKDSGTVSITNPNRFGIKVQTEAEDFIAGDEKGTPQFIPQGSGVTTLASWINLSLKNFNLDPLETKDVSFDINVPKEAEPGGHYAAVFFKMLPQKVKGQTQIGISGRVGTLVLVSVPGNVTQTGRIVGFTSSRLVNKGPVNFNIRFENTGSVHYSSKGTIKIISALGNNVANIPTSEHIILPKSIRQFNGMWETGYQIGIYTATLTMKDGYGKVLTKSLKIVMFPWQEGLIVVGVFLLLYVSVVVIKKKYTIVKK